MPDSDLTALAASLADVSLNLADYIERRAREIAEPRIQRAETWANEQINRLHEEHRAENRRKDDLIRELRRQLDAQVKQNERLHREVKETRSAVRRVEALHVWTNEDGKRFVFVDDLWSALAEAGSPAARALAEIQRRREQATTITSEGN
jgi:hypothetical protein